MLSQVVTALIVLIFSLWGLNDVIAAQPEDQLAQKISCPKDEIRYYRYKSDTSLWGLADGKISVLADITLHCLGDDSKGKYGPEAFRYVIQLDNLGIREHDSSEKFLKRKKRGFLDSVSNAWKKVKTFFKRLFGKGDPEGPPVVETEERHSTGDENPQVEREPDEPEDFQYGSSASVPFEFIQLMNGSVPEVLFSEDDNDPRIRNFKRHFADMFTTQLNMHPRYEVVVEKTTMGEHLSNYDISIGGETAAFSSSSLQLGDAIRENNEGKTVVVKKIVTDEDILQLASTTKEPAINDKDKMGLQTTQTQIFKNGQLMSASGTSSLALFESKEKKKRQQRDVNEKEIMSFFQIQSNYELQLHSKRKRRSTGNEFPSAALQEDSHYFAASRAAELEESSDKQNLRKLQMSIGNASLLIDNLTYDKIDDYDDKMQLLFEVVVQEVRLGLDREPQSMCVAVRKNTIPAIKRKCPTTLKNCRDFLQLLARAGGSEAEQFLLHCVSSESIDQAERQECADNLSDLSNPSPNCIDELIALMQRNNMDPKLLGLLCLSTSNLATAVKKSAHSEKQLRSLAEVLVSILRTSLSKTEAIPLTIDTLEAIGNLGHESTVDPVLEVSSGAPEKTEVQIACAHALRHLASLPRVQKWMLTMILHGSCEVKHAIVGSLLDRMHGQERIREDKEWPLFGVNELDVVLQKKLESSSPEFTCVVEDAMKYFSRKKGDEAEKLNHLNHFSSDSEPWEPEFSKGMRRKKRSIYMKDLNCQEWTNDSSYKPVRDKGDLADMALYNRSKSCQASRRLGVKGANAMIQAALFAGVQDPSSMTENERPKYKLKAKFVSEVNFMGHNMELGSVHFNQQNEFTKFYVRIMGRTRQEFRTDGCTPNDLKYRPITHIPLYSVSISIVRLDLGIHLSSQFSLNTECPQYDVYDLRPKSDVRIGGEAMGTVLFARAALNLGGNFNYHTLLSFSPSPQMCLKGEHGYDPMSISMEAYFRLWNIRKLSWGKPKIWRPSSLIWDLISGNQRPWFDNTCLLSESPPTEMGTTTSTISTSTDTTENDSNSPSDSNDLDEDGKNVLVVQA